MMIFVIRIQSGILELQLRLLVTVCMYSQDT